MNIFHKYHGAGNDFVIINNFDGWFDIHDHDLIASICHRRFGVGADGFISIEKPDHHDFEMIYCNSDGHIGTMCGNGGRCAVKFAHDQGIINDSTTFSASDGIHKAQINSNKNVSLSMSDAQPPEKTKFGWTINTGSPHLVVEIENIGTINVFDEGRRIRNNKYFAPDGINVNFIENQNNKINIRTYERGVEDETWACGTGSIAAALVQAYKEGLKKGKKHIVAKGGNLEVSFIKTSLFQDIWLTGSAVHVCDIINFNK